MAGADQRPSAEKPLQTTGKTRSAKSPHLSRGVELRQPWANTNNPKGKRMTDPRLLALIPVLTRLSRHLTGNPAMADDLLQDTLLNLCNRLTKGAEIDDLRPYALATMRNIHRATLRRARPQDALNDSDAITLPDPLLRLTCAEVTRAIQNLPPDQSRLMRLVAAGETSPAALARALDLPLGTVMSRLSRARARLRADMGMGAQAHAAALWQGGDVFTQMH